MSTQMRAVSPLCRSETDEIKYEAGVPVPDAPETTSQPEDDFVSVERDESGEQKTSAGAPTATAAAAADRVISETSTATASSFQFVRDGNGNLTLNGVAVINDGGSGDLLTALQNLISRNATPSPAPKTPEPAQEPKEEEKANEAEQEDASASSLSENKPWLSSYELARLNAIKRAKRMEIDTANKKLDLLELQLNAAADNFKAEMAKLDTLTEAEEHIEEQLITVCKGTLQAAEFRKESQRLFRRTFGLSVSEGDESVLGVLQIVGSQRDRDATETDDVLAAATNTFTTAQRGLQKIRSGIMVQRPKVIAAQRKRLTSKTNFADQEAVVENLKRELEALDL